MTFSALELVICLAMIFARIIFNTCVHPLSSKNPDFFSTALSYYTTLYQVDGFNITSIRLDIFLVNYEKLSISAADDTLTAVCSDRKIIYLWNISRSDLLGSSFKPSNLHRVPSILNLAKKRLDATCLGECVKHWLVPGCFQYFTCDSVGFFC